jgi:hypothetical protein
MKYSARTIKAVEPQRSKDAMIPDGKNTKPGTSKPGKNAKGTFGPQDAQKTQKGQQSQPISPQRRKDAKRTQTARNHNPLSRQNQARSQRKPQALEAESGLTLESRYSGFLGSGSLASLRPCGEAFEGLGPAPWLTVADVTLKSAFTIYSNHYLRHSAPRIDHNAPYMGYSAPRLS